MAPSSFKKLAGGAAVVCAMAMSAAATDPSYHLSEEYTPASSSPPPALVSPTRTSTRHVTWTSLRTSTGTVFATSLSTVTAGASTASLGRACDVTTLVVAVSTGPLRPVTATEAASTRREPSLPERPSNAVVPAAPAPSATATFENSPANAAASSSGRSSSASPAASSKTTLTTAAPASRIPTTTTTTTPQSVHPAPVAGTTEVVSAMEIGGGLELATEKPNSYSLEWLTEMTPAVASATSAGALPSSTGSGAAASPTLSCSGLDCIVVSNGGGRVDAARGSGGLALQLVVLAGVGMFLF